MTDDDQVPFMRRLVALAALFDKELAPSTQVLYFEGLRDLSLEDCVRAMSAAVTGCTFMPKPVELRHFVVSSDEDAAEAAWIEFRRQARLVGAYQSPVFEDAALADALLAIFRTWPAACQTDLSPEMWASTRKEFGRVYRVYRARGVSGTRVLTNWCEFENQRLEDTQHVRDMLSPHPPPNPPELP
jgi:hypothetical protein